MLLKVALYIVLSLLYVDVVVMLATGVVIMLRYLNGLIYHIKSDIEFCNKKRKLARQSRNGE